MKTEPKKPLKGEGREQINSQPDQDFDWIEALVDKFQDSGRPAKDLRRAWSRAVAKLA